MAAAVGGGRALARQATAFDGRGRRSRSKESMMAAVTKGPMKAAKSNKLAVLLTVSAGLVIAGAHVPCSLATIGPCSRNGVQ